MSIHAPSGDPRLSGDTSPRSAFHDYIAQSGIEVEFGRKVHTVRDLLTAVEELTHWPVRNLEKPMHTLLTLRCNWITKYGTGPSLDAAFGQHASNLLGSDGHSDVEAEYLQHVLRQVEQQYALTYER